jgi:hypothetical protein
MKRYWIHPKHIEMGSDAYNMGTGNVCEKMVLADDVEPLLAQCEEALKSVRDWRALDGDCISTPTWNRVLSALYAIRAALEDSHDK